MWDFQPIAKILVHAHKKNYLESCIHHKESDTRHGWYDLVIVLGGLSREGEIFLAAPESDETEDNLEKIIQLKPSIYGVSVDLNALWRRWKSKKN